MAKILGASVQWFSPGGCPIDLDGYIEKLVQDKEGMRHRAALRGTSGRHDCYVTVLRAFKACIRLKDDSTVSILSL